MKARLIFLLDRSGSMGTILDDTIGGFNTYLENLQSGEGADEMTMTRIQFDSSSIDTEFKDQPIKACPGLDRDNFVPRDATPLLEAATKAIEAAAEKDYDGKTIMAIMTDGHENRSAPEYTNERLAGLIAEKRAQGWEFVFLGAGIDAYAQARQLGIGASATMSYNAKDAVATMSGYSSLAANTRAFAAGAAPDMGFSAEQKLSAGDKFAGLTPKVEAASPATPTPQPKAADYRKVDL